MLQARKQPSQEPRKKEFAVADFVVKRAHFAVVGLPKSEKRVRLYSEKPRVLSLVLALEKPLL